MSFCIRLIGIISFITFCVWTNVTNARPAYLKQFSTQYPQLGNKTADVKCLLCHSEQSKQHRNNYGMGVDRFLNGKNEKQADLILQALLKAEELPSDIPGKTFGDLIKEGHLPSETE